MNQPHTSHTLSLLGPNEFQELIRDNLGREADPALWEALTTPEVIHRTKDYLGSLIADLVTQAQGATAALLKHQAECFPRGEEGKADYIAAKAKDAEWRGRLYGYRRLAETRLAYVKARVPRPAQRQSPYGAGFSQRARKHNRAALEKLASAVAEHRRRVTSGEEITAITSAGEELPLTEWLEYLEDQRDDADADLPVQTGNPPGAQNGQRG